jgi:hypothetical protein
MHRLCALLFASSLCVLPASSGGVAEAAHIIQPSPTFQPPLLLEAMYNCGMFDGHFGCRQVPGSVDHGKNATVPSPPAETPEAATGEPGALPPAGSTGQWNQNVEQEPVKPGEHSCPPGDTVLAVPGPDGYCEAPAAPAAAAANAGCEHGMVGTPPNCGCPKNSELLGGNCVHYTAICRTGLPANVAPQPCEGADEKLACKSHDNGLKDCCCLTYDKL